MTDQTPSEIERDAERVRAEIADTADQLKDKMSPGQLMDEMVDYFKDGDASQLITNLKHQVRDNPLALAMVGGGLAWLMMGSGPSAGTGTSTHSHPTTTTGLSGQSSTGSNAYGRSSVGATSASPPSSGHGSALSGAATGARDAAVSAAGKVSGAASSASSSVSATLHDMRDGASDGMAHATQAGADMGARVKTTFLDALEREPLVIGALGIAVGAAIGAMIPATRAEQEYLGEASAKAREAASDALSDGIDKAKGVAKDVYAAARDEADDQGLMPGTTPVSAKLAEVAKAAGNELKSATDQSLHDAGTMADDKTNRLPPEGKPQV